MKFILRLVSVRLISHLWILADSNHFSFIHEKRSDNFVSNLWFLYVWCYTLYI